jgi:hypothetical protein
VLPDDAAERFGAVVDAAVPVMSDALAQMLDSSAGTSVGG